MVEPFQTYSKQLTQRAKDFQTLKENKDYQIYSQLAKDNLNKTLAQSRQQTQAPPMDLIGKNKDIQFKKIWSNQQYFEEWKKNKKGKYSKWQGTEEDINGDKFPEFVVRDDRGYNQSADRFRITVSIKHQRVTKYFNENSTKAECQQKHYKAWKEEDKPAECYKHFIKNFLSPFLKVHGYTVAQVYSVIGGRI
ncbi:MAG: hypothetical protein EZS28_001374 [Streblomastix strix]|uniref:Uncharacterized protein n=1 Tax=Streblomastix strix TaxID=222440 RepID=A0A5J4X8J9_9EUKA|nr:MAG: hypothetical protein EZS28_001374 [Streblomastix strix]